MSQQAASTESWKFNATSSAAATHDPIADTQRFDLRRLPGETSSPVVTVRSPSVLRSAFSEWGRTGFVREGFDATLVVRNG